jgi:hypothetical protein
MIEQQRLEKERVHEQRSAIAPSIISLILLCDSLRKQSTHASLHTREGNPWFGMILDHQADDGSEAHRRHPPTTEEAGGRRANRVDPRDPTDVHAPCIHALLCC